MLSWGIMFVAIIAAAYGHYEVAFWTMVLNLISAAATVTAVVRDPSWYMARRGPSLSLSEESEDEIITIVASQVVLISPWLGLGLVLGTVGGIFLICCRTMKRCRAKVGGNFKGLSNCYSFVWFARALARGSGIVSIGALDDYERPGQIRSFDDTNSANGKTQTVTTMRILVVEDDTQTAALVGQALRDDGHAVDVVAEGREGLKRGAINAYDVLVVDRMLPGLDGLSIVQSLRTAGVKSAIMLLTSMGAIEDRIEGLEGGGDDYLVKPFALGELVARVNALGRRSTLLNDEVVLRVADLELHRIRREVKRNGQPITLQPREFKMLETLMRNKGQVITKTMFLRDVWDFEFDLKTSIVSTNISRLRDKIDRPGDTPLIHTVRGVGYRIDEPH